MKKALTLLLALVMVLSLVACSTANQTTTGSKNDPTTKPTTGNTTVPGTTAQPTEPTQHPTTAPTEPAPTEPAPSNPIEPDNDFNEIVIVDNAHCTFKIVDITADSMYYNLKVYLENKSSVTQMFSWNAVTVNNYMIDPFWACDLGAGNNTYSEISFLLSEFESNGIVEATKIEFTMHIYDYDSWDAQDFFNEVCTIYPLGEDAFVDDGGYTAQEGDIVLVDNEHVTAIVTNFDPNGFWGYTMHLYLENKTSTNLTFSANDVTINNLMLDPWWATEVAAGKRTHCEVFWFSSDFDKYQITEVTIIDFFLSASDPMDWESADLANTHCTVYPMGEEAAKCYDRTELDTDIVLLDNEYVTITIVSLGYDEYMSYVMELFIESKVDYTVRISAEQVTLNTSEIDPWWAATVSGGKCVYSTISWFGSDLEFYGITIVESISMNMQIFDEEAWEPFITQDVIVNP